MTVKNGSVRFILPVLAGFCLIGLGRPAQAQLIRAPLDSGFVRTSSISMTVDEMLGYQKARTAEEAILGPGYPQLWIAEVQFKPLRYRRIDVLDPQTGQRRPELVWYMVYRAIPRDYTELAGENRDDLIRKLSDTSLLPQNSIDAVTRYPLMMPRFILRTDDAEDAQYYIDEVNPEIQRIVMQREFRQRGDDVQLLNSIQAVSEVAEPVSVNDPEQLAQAVYGVAIWRNVDPTTDYLTVTMTGFSNAYRISQNAAGETVVEHKVIEQRFGRPGDEFKQEESEFRLINEAHLEPNGDVVVNTETSTSTFRKDRPAPDYVSRLRQSLEAQLASGEKPEQSWPSWHYRSRIAEIAVPEYDRILRNARNDGDQTPPAQ